MVQLLETRRLLDGSLDSTFDADGRLLVDFSGLAGADARSIATSIAFQSDGRMIVAGGGASLGGLISKSLFVSRVNPEGSLDSSFGQGGLVFLTIPEGIVGKVVSIVQPDGKILLLGAGNSSYSLFAVRLNADGSLDPTFGTNGLARVNFSITSLGGAVVAGDGSLIVAGRPYGSTAAVAKLLPDGTLDPSFGTAGIAEMPPGAAAVRALLLQADGKIVVGADPDPMASDQPVAYRMVRLNADGSIDSGFGVGGVAAVDFGPRFDGVVGMATQPDGRLLLLTADKSAFSVARFKTDGTLDTFFGVQGKASVAPENQSAVPTSMVVDAGGRIYVAGKAGSSMGAGGPASISMDDFAVARLTPSGAIDSSFGTKGWLGIDFSKDDDPDRGDSVYALAIQPATGKLLLAGESWAGSQSTIPRGFGIARIIVATGTTTPGTPTSPTTPTPTSPGNPTTPTSPTKPNSPSSPRILFIYGIKRPAVVRGAKVQAPPPAPAPVPVARVPMLRRRFPSPGPFRRMRWGG